MTTELLLAAASDANLYAARYQMAISLGFHIILAAFGVAYPLITLIAHRRGLAKKDPDALRLAKRWSKNMAVLFAVGAVSGTILSFEMGMLWPGLMGPFGDVIGVPFALEGVFFFVEAIFIAIYLYGWNRLPATVHMLTLVPIAIAGLAGSFFIISVNGWMNGPQGFTIAANGDIVDVNPWAAMMNSAAVVEWVHMLLAAYMMTGFLVASVYAVRWLRGDRTPAKFAAMELIPGTETNVPLTVGGLYLDGEVRWAIEIPGLASLLGTRSFDGELPGLDGIPVADTPPVNVVHIAFQVMVGIGTLLLMISAWFGWSWWRTRGPPNAKVFWVAASVSGLAAIVALESGWIVTEVGRQPWIVWHLVRTSDAVSLSTGIVASAITISLVYLGLGIVTIVVLRIISQRMEAGEDVETPYGPSKVDR
jgi:cytochrome d ubiquinol oxidase subunit I